jgi:signal transduction histidine kinase
MRFVPRSLFTRLVLVLMAGLLVAQGLSLAIHTHERGRLLAQASGVQSAQRIADIVKVLDPLTPEERRKMVSILSAPPLTISLAAAPATVPLTDADSRARGAFFERMLARHVGSAHPVSVSVTEALPWKGAGKMRAFEGTGMRGAGMGGAGGPHMPGQAAFAFIARVGLSDGTTVVFDSRQPEATLTWPYRLIGSLAILLAAVIALSLLAVRWATRPLKTLADAADELGRDIHRPPLPETGPTEVERAARAFNAMQAKLASLLRERTDMLAAISHDLKTPITRLRLRAELLDDPDLKARFGADFEELEVMVSRTLDFVRGLGSDEPPQPVDMNALLQSVQADMQETGNDVALEGAALAPYVGRALALKRCITNLVDNAVRYGGSARIAVEDDQGTLRIRIADGGPGIPAADLERVFDPFVRLDRSRNRETGGTGLGLSIARSIVNAHGGTLTLANRHAGGLEATLTLPRTRHRTAQ